MAACLLRDYNVYSIHDNVFCNAFGLWECLRSRTVLFYAVCDMADWRDDNTILYLFCIVYQAAVGKEFKGV